MRDEKIVRKGTMETMKYSFKFGRGKKVIISGSESFETLGYGILREYHIRPEHIYCFNFANGDMTNCATPLGPINDGIGNVSIETKIKDRKMEIGEEMMGVLIFWPFLTLYQKVNTSAVSEEKISFSTDTAFFYLPND